MPILTVSLWRCCRHGNEWYNPNCVYFQQIPGQVMKTFPIAVFLLEPRIKISIYHSDHGREESGNGNDIFLRQLSWCTIRLPLMPLFCVWVLFSMFQFCQYYGKLYSLVRLYVGVFIYILLQTNQFKSFVQLLVLCNVILNYFRGFCGL
jgi:hypothetical protein